MKYEIRDTPTLAEPPTLTPLRVFDGEASRARLLAALRERLGREPTAEDIEAEKAREIEENPLRVITMPEPGDVDAFNNALAAYGEDAVFALPKSALDGFGPAAQMPPGFYHNHAEPCGTDGCKGGVRAGSLSLLGGADITTDQTTAPEGAKKEDDR